MLKKLIHFLTNRSLEKHRHKTQCMIDEYEREAAASQARVQAKADAYKHQIQQLAKLRQEELEKYVALLNDHIEQTTDYVAYLEELPAAMFLCVEIWLRKNISEQRWNLDKEKVQVIVSTIDYLDVLAEEMVRLSREQDRKAWQNIIADRPPRISTAAIIKHTKDFLRDAKSDAKEYDRALRRIESYKRLLRKQQSELRKSIAALKAEVDKHREEHRQVKQRVKQLNELCSTKFRELQEVFENYYQFTQTDSPLANEWISQMPHGGNLKEILLLISDTAPMWEEAKANISDLHDQRKHVQSRIDQAYQDQEYESLDGYKAERTGIYESLNHAKARKDDVFAGRQALYQRRDEIKKLLGWINELHPSKIIEQIFHLLAREDTEIYWPAIGLATKTVRPPAGSRK
ncbi:TPA: hypothetical protein ACLEAZ_004313 [Pseudomonas aeruginosa]